MITILFYTGLAFAFAVGWNVIDILKDRAETVNLSEKQLLVGYSQERFFKRPIIIDMAITAHLFVCGLSQCGKSKMVEYAMKDKNVILVNVFKEDFKSIKTRRVNGKEKIKEFLKSLINEPYYRDTPLYIVMDELLVLCMDKEKPGLIMDLLAVGRHYNIFVIGISQIGTKETVKFKDLFNARICFRQVEDSSYRTVLGYTPENTYLLPRQFYLYSDQLAYGRTYDT
jgi:DNA segregation ATPase FtsK/SpoIIIE-like protein